MSKGVHVMSWVTPEVKHRFAELARAQGLSESAYLRRVVHSLVQANGGPPESEVLAPLAPLPKDLRIAFRLRPDDHRLLRDRASARSMPTSSYVAALVRSHLRHLAPLPSAELEAFKSATAELSAIGRNLNQIAHAVNRGGIASGPSIELFQEMLRALTLHRDRIKGLILRNAESWEVGYEQTDKTVGRAADPGHR
jgi:hypothetical protein